MPNEQGIPMSNLLRKRPLVVNLILLLLLTLLSGCGDVNWFPEYKRQPTTPDQFAFATKKNQPLNTAVSSDPITVAGLTADSSPVSVTGPTAANSKYSIDGGTPTSTAGTVKNGQKVTVTQTTGTAPGQSLTSTLTIGDVSATFTTQTQLISASSFSTPISVAGGALETFTTITSVDTNTHTVSIKDSANSTSAQFAVADINGNPTFFTNVQQTVAVLNNLRIYVRNSQLNVTNGVTTTLTIDGVNILVPLKTP
jgi:hypothetical protein